MESFSTVLGASGFIGGRLVNEIKKRGKNCWAPAKQDPEIFCRPLGTIFYCVGLTNDYCKNPIATVDAHVNYLTKILENANFEHLIYLSSTRLYDGLDIVTANANTILSIDPRSRRHLFDLTKLLGENLCLSMASGRSSIARISSVYDLEPRSSGFLSELLQRIPREKSLVLESSPTFCRDYISLDDCISSLIGIAESRFDGILNVASGDNTYNYQIADLLEQYGIKLGFNKTAEPMHLARCEIKTLHELGIYPENTLSKIEHFAKKLQEQ